MEETACTTDRLEPVRDRQIHMHFRRVPGARRVPCFPEASRKPVVVETGCIEPKSDASDVLTLGQTFQQFAAAPVRELNRHPPLGSPSLPLLDMGIPLRKGRFLTRDTGVRQVHRQTDHVARESGMFLKCPAHGLVDLWPLAMSQREEVLRLPGAFRTVPEYRIALNAGVGAALPDEPRTTGDLRPRELGAELLEPLVTSSVQGPY